MATGAQTWSTSAASNNSADGSVNWAEGMAPSAVNNSARAEMASAAMWIKDNSGTLLTSGSTAAYTVTSMQVSSAVVNGYTIAVNFHASNSANATLNVDGVGAKAIQLVAGTNVSTGDITGGVSHRLQYSSSSTAWIIVGANAFGASSVTSDKLADDAVGLTKIANINDGTVLANVSGGAASPTAVVIGTGLSYSTTTLSAPAFPPTSAWKNLSIKTATTTTIDCAADFVTMATSGSSSFITLPASGTINMATTGAANGLASDSTALANSTFYYIYAIAGTSTSSHADFLASVSATTPLMPSGYAYKARLGAQVTTTTTATAALHGVYQYGRRASYVQGVAGTTAAVTASSGTAGNVATPAYEAVDLSPFKPTTSNVVWLIAACANASGNILVAPSTSFPGTGADLNGRAPICMSGIVFGHPTSLTLQTTNVYWASTGSASAGIIVTGWEDNI